jgi:hypothetical protein
MSSLIFNKLAELERRIKALEDAKSVEALVKQLAAYTPPKRGPGRPRKQDG